MAENKTFWKKLSELANLKVNEEDPTLVANEYDAEMPDNWDEMSEDEQKAWKEKHMMKPNKVETAQTPASAQTAVTATVTNAQQPAPKPDENTIWLNSLIEGMGGREAFQGLLLGAVKAVEMQQNGEASEKESIIAALVQNSEGRLNADDLKGMELSVLRIMEKGMVPQQITDYRLLAGGPVKANKEEMAQMPDIFAADTWKQ